MATEPAKAAVRCNVLKTLSDVAGQERHGQGYGKTAEQGIVRDGPRCIAALPGRKPVRCAMGSNAPELRLREALDAHQQREGAVTRKDAAACLHFVVFVSPRWLDSPTHDRHDPDNPRIEALRQAAVDWVNEEFAMEGVEAAFASRCDLNETNAANVDVFAAPVMRHGRSKKKFIRPVGAKREWAKQHGVPYSKSFSLMQDRWTAFASERLGYAFERGEPKEITGRKNLSPTLMREIRKSAAPELLAENDELKAENNALRERCERLECERDEARGELAQERSKRMGKDRHDY